MLKFRITHHYATGRGWGYFAHEFAMSGGLEHLPHYTFADSCREAEAGTLFYLEGEAEERGEAPPQPQDVQFEHELERANAVAA